jgi:hypothetical protein
MKEDFDYVTYTWIGRNGGNAFSESHTPALGPQETTSINPKEQHSDFNKSDKHLDSYHLYFSSKL